MRKLQRWLSSPRLAWWLLLVLLGCLLISFVVPQRPLVGEAIYSAWRADAGWFAAAADGLGLASVFTSPLFLLGMTLLFANLAFCTAQRVATRRRRQVKPLKPAETVTEFVIDPDASPEETRVLAPPFWVLHQPAQGHYLWERGVWGWRGSIVMHIGMLLLLVAGLVSGFTRFSGTLVLAETQTIADAPDAYTGITQSPRYGPAFSGAPLTFRDLQVTYEGSTIVDVVANMSEGPQGALQAARVNRPFRAGGKAYLLSRSGHAVALKVTEKDKPLFEAVVNLGGVSRRGNTDKVTVREGLDVSMTVLPNGAIDDSGVKRRLLLVDPVVELQASGFGPAVLLRPGESSRVGDLTVEVLDVLYWTEFLARSDRGLALAYLSFALILAGVIVRWIDPDVQVALLVSDEGNSAKIWYRSRFSSDLGSRAADSLVAELQADRKQAID